MSQTISNFKGGFNGGTRANRFKVSIDWPAVTLLPGGHSLEFHAVAAKLPSAELGTIKVPYRGRMAYYAGDRDYKPWTVTILDDTGKNESWKAFHEWADALGAHDTNTAADKTYAASSANNGNGHWLRTVTFTQLHSPSATATSGAGFEDLKKITLKHAWPQEISEISLDMQEGGSFISYNVTFVYDYYTIDNYGG